MDQAGKSTRSPSAPSDQVALPPLAATRRTLLSWPIMNTLAQIEEAAESLPRKQQEQLLAFLAARLVRNGETASEPVAVPRCAGLHEGVWDVAPDFDTPLPDDFWLGRDA